MPEHAEFIRATCRAEGALNRRELRLARHIHGIVQARSAKISPVVREKSGRMGWNGTHGSAVAAVRGVGAELSRDMYSVLRSQETCAATGGVPPEWLWWLWFPLWRPKSAVPPAGSSSRAWSFGSSNGGCRGSGFRAVVGGNQTKEKEGKLVGGVM